MIWDYPFERDVLLALAIWRAWFTAACGLLGVATGWRGMHRVWLAVVLGALFSAAGAWSSADVIEHYVFPWLTGLPAYNPYVRSIGEWEGWMGPTVPEDVVQWRAQMCRRQPIETPWWGDVTSFCR